MIQQIVVFAVVGLAAVYLMRTLYRQAKGKDECGCGCTGCADTTACEGHSGHFPGHQSTERNEQ